MNNGSKTFDLATVLTITSGRYFTDIKNVFEILSFVCNNQITDYNEMPYYHPVVQSYLLKKYPQLRNVGLDIKTDTWDDVHNFINSQIKIYGDKFEIEPLSRVISFNVNSSNKFKQGR